jgi:hypothetical protein
MCAGKMHSGAGLFLLELFFWTSKRKVVNVTKRSFHLLFSLMRKVTPLMAGQAPESRKSETACAHAHARSSDFHAYALFLLRRN